MKNNNKRELNNNTNLYNKSEFNKILAIQIVSCIFNILMLLTELVILIGNYSNWVTSLIMLIICALSLYTIVSSTVRCVKYKNIFKITNNFKEMLKINEMKINEIIRLVSAMLALMIVAIYDFVFQITSYVFNIVIVIIFSIMIYILGKLSKDNIQILNNIEEMNRNAQSNKK